MLQVKNLIRFMLIFFNLDWSLISSIILGLKNLTCAEFNFVL